MTKQGYGEKKVSKKSTIRTTILIALVALVSITAATAAWFTIADNTRLRGIGLDITTGQSLRFDLDPHATIEEYVQTLSFAQIADRIQQDIGVDITFEPMEPVTTDDGITFSYQFGQEAAPESGDFIHYTLHFMASKDMLVHLTRQDGDDEATLIIADNDALVRALRIGFYVDGKFLVYDPDMGDEAEDLENMRIFGISNAEEMIYNDNNVLFPITTGKDKVVEVYIWLEGSDEECTNDLKLEQFSIRMKFTGTDENNMPFE